MGVAGCAPDEHVYGDIRASYADGAADVTAVYTAFGSADSRAIGAANRAAIDAAFRAAYCGAFWTAYGEAE